MVVTSLRLDFGGENELDDVGGERGFGRVASSGDFIR